MLSGFVSLTRHWFPARVDRSAVAPQLEHFYASRDDYHEMTAGEDKINHPQVQLLLSLIRPADRIVEFGCGGGVVLSAAGRRAHAAIGMDISAIALGKASARPGHHRVVKADLARTPLASACADMVYSFEVLEHVWDPAKVIQEMVRVARPGGRVLFTTPNGYSMDLHLPLRPAVRALNHLGAAASLALASTRRQPFENIPPDLDARPVYPDCDMITRVHPLSLERFARRIGCEPERLETFFFQREKAGSRAERERFARLERQALYHWHGDHILFLGRKKQ